MTDIKSLDRWTFRANGIPKGQPRPRAFARKMDNGKFRARVYDAGTAEAWKSDVARACEPLAGRRLIEPIRLTLTFYFPRPKSHYRTNGALKPSAPRLIHDSAPDVDNAAKAVLDAMTHIGVWQDDDQVTILCCIKTWEQPGQHSPGADIDIETLAEIDT